MADNQVVSKRVRVRKVHAAWAAGAAKASRERARGKDRRSSRFAQQLATPRRGQAIIIVALSLTVLILFVGLAVDVGNLLGKRSKLQSAVDSAVLSAAQEMGGTITTTAYIKAFQVLNANGILTPSLNMAETSVQVIPQYKQVRMRAVQRVETYFMRIIPLWQTMEISSEATADLNNFAEINYKPYGKPGTVTELNMMVWGRYSSRRGGDAYSPEFVGNTSSAPNPYYVEMPHGYLFRIDVPQSYVDITDTLDVEIWDPDTYNKPGIETPPAWPTPFPTCVAPCTPTPTPTLPTPVPDMFARCADPNRPAPTPALLGGGERLCSSHRYNHSSGNYTKSDYDLTSDPATYIGSFTKSGEDPRPAFWRADEYRRPYNLSMGNGDATHATTTQFTLWHFNPRINSAFGPPDELSDQPAGKYLARWTIAANLATDLRWYSPRSGGPGTMTTAGTINSFKIKLRDPSCSGFSGNDCYEREETGGMYFYLYVQGTAGSSENNYDLRVGPPQANSCGDVTQRHCYINNQYYDWARSNWPDWYDGGARIFAKRALPLNLLTGSSFPLAMTQVSKNAEGQVLGVKHFDQDCDGTCSETMTYQMQKCVDLGAGYVPCPNIAAPTCWENVGTGYKGPNDGWARAGRPNPEEIQVPWEGSAEYADFFGPAGQCDVSWVRIASNPSYSNDTTVWEMPFLRPRLIR